MFSSIPILIPSGKLDKKALPPLQPADEFNQDFTTLTATEQILAPLWVKLLNLRSVDIQESFFDMGG